jgi:hypothetical protein
VTVDSAETVTLAPLHSSPAHRLGEWGATAIRGNDITSSCLYVAALATIYGPELIERLSREWGIPKNYMFIGSPSGRFPYRISELGGVRLII